MRVLADRRSLVYADVLTAEFEISAAADPVAVYAAPTESDVSLDDDASGGS